MQMPMFIMIGSRMMAAIWPGFSLKRRLTTLRSLNWATSVFLTVSRGLRQTPVPG